MTHNSLSVPENRWLTVALLAVVLLAFLIRIYVVFSYEMPSFTYGENSHIAVNMTTGKGYTFNFYGLRPDKPLQSFVPPLYTWVVWLCLIAFEDAPHALGVLHAIFGTITLPLLFYVTDRLSDNKVGALFATFCAAFYPPSVLSIVRPQTLTLNVLLIALLLAISIRLYEKQDLFWSIAFGLMLGVTLHSRPMLLAYAFILVTWLHLNGIALRKVLMIGLAVAVSSIIASTPWTARNYRVHQHFVFMAVNGGFNFWTGNNSFTTGSGHEVYTKRAYEFLGREMEQDAPVVQEMHRYPLPTQIAERIATINEVELDRQLYLAGFEYIQEHPIEGLQLMWIKLKSFVWFRPNIGSRYDETWTLYYKYLYALLLMPFVIGVAISTARWKRYSLLYMLFGYYTVFYTTFQVQTRYRWEIEPYFFVFAALTFAAVLGHPQSAQRNIVKATGLKKSNAA